jgi:plastocyanin
MKLHGLLTGIACGCVALATLAGCTQPGGEAAAPGIDTVIISGMQFHPSELYINKGDTILWINRDMVNHDVTGLPGKSWTSDTLYPGSNWELSPYENTDYFCSIHPTMKGKVIIRQ